MNEDKEALRAALKPILDAVREDPELPRETEESRRRHSMLAQKYLEKQFTI